MIPESVIHDLKQITDYIRGLISDYGEGLMKPNSLLYSLDEIASRLDNITEGVD